MKLRQEEGKDMKAIVKQLTILCMALAIAVGMLPMLGGQTAYAESETDVTKDGVTYHLWYGSEAASVAVRSYNGSATQVVLHESVTCNGTTYKTGDTNNTFFIEKTAFAGNTKITQITIPDGYFAINEGSFKGCTSLKNYYLKGTIVSVDNMKNSGIGMDASGNPIAGVTVYTKEGSNVDKAIKELNNSRTSGYKITLKYETNPYNTGVAKSTTNCNIGGGTSNNTENQKGADGTYYSRGASEKAINKAIASLKNDKDPKGTSFGLLQAKAKGAAKNSVTLGWTSVKGAKKYVVYGNACNVGKKVNKYVKLKTTTKKSITIKKIKGKKVKKGTYYKFMVVALDKNNRVIGSSKTVHVATKGGKVGNDKTVTTAAKKNKVALKKGKTFRLKAKAVPASKKLKVRRHRKISYESSNSKIATVKNGVITAKKKGTCYVYAYAQNGVFKKIKVTVK